MYITAQLRDTANSATVPVSVVPHEAAEVAVWSNLAGVDDGLSVGAVACAGERITVRAMDAGGRRWDV